MCYIMLKLDPSYYTFCCLVPYPDYLYYSLRLLAICAASFFLQVAELTDSIQEIVEALQGSPFVEVQVFSCLCDL